MRTVIHGHLLYDSPSTGAGGSSTPSSGGGYHYVGDASTDYPTDGFAIEYVLVGAVVSTALTTSTYTSGQIIAWPFVNGRTGVVDQVEIECTAGAGATRLGRVAIYNNASRTRLYPTSRVFDSGDIDLSTTGLKTVTASFTLREGSMYWAAYNTNNATPVIRSVAAGSTLPAFGSSKAAAPCILVYNSFSFNEAYSGLSDPFPPAGTGTAGASAVAQNGNVPAVLLRFGS